MLFPLVVLGNMLGSNLKFFGIHWEVKGTWCETHENLVELGENPKIQKNKLKKLDNLTYGVHNYKYNIGPRII